MKKAFESIPYTPLEQKENQQADIRQKSIPAQVFLNYFTAINYHIQHNQEPGLQTLPFFQQLQPLQLNTDDEVALRRLLLSCWSTEFALRSTAELGNADYLRYALHWTFPQAYYTVLAGLQAFLLTLNFRSRNPEAIARQLGRLVLQRAYPRAVGYYAAGPYPEVSLHRLPLSGYKAGLQIPEQELDAQAQIGQFLRTSRRLKAQAIRRELQSNPQTALRSPKTGKILEKWNKSHWQQISWRLGYTTYFDLLSRLR
ncbi:hypothetical protein, partial [Cesiribacter andamanensis]|uniref:hypothetical protein n=1 Tax=Cesiribacter andamanensis TaxID=649507 RepID=UPI00058F81F5